MDKAALSPDPSPAGLETLSYDDAGCVRLSEFLHTRPAPRGNGDDPVTVPAPLASSARSSPMRSVYMGPARQRTDVLEGLRSRIRHIERGSLSDGRLRGGMAGEAVSTDAGTWRAPAALDAAACHELKPSSNAAGSYASALAFALGLARRRQDRARRQTAASPPRILWCTTQAASGETGRLYGPGLARFGLDASCFIIVETARAAEALWAMEEGLKSGAVSLVIGCLDEAALTPARRLSLAAQERATPCLLITNARTPAAAATATRWRIGPEPSAPHPFDPRAPGPLRWGISLERCRGLNVSAETRFSLDWCHDAFCFRMVAAVADREIAPPRAYRRAG